MKSFFFSSASSNVNPPKNGCTSSFVTEKLKLEKVRYYQSIQVQMRDLIREWGLIDGICDGAKRKSKTCTRALETLGPRFLLRISSLTSFGLDLL